MGLDREGCLWNEMGMWCGNVMFINIKNWNIVCVFDVVFVFIRL